MAYGYPYGGYPNGFYTPPMPDQLAQLRQNPMMQTQAPQAPPVAPPPAPSANNGITWVQGEEGAKAYMVAPNNTVLLMDSDGTSFYLKSADASGMPQLRIFDYKERVAAPKTTQDAFSQHDVDYVTREELNALAVRVDALAAVSTPAAPAHAKPRKRETETGAMNNG